jgi:hypothetical protein
MAWENLAEDILGDFASFYGRTHDRGVQLWNHHQYRLKETKATFYQKLKCDTKRKAEYAAANKRRERQRYERLKGDPIAFAAWVQKLAAYVEEQPREARRARSSRYYQRHRQTIAAKRNTAAAKAAKKAYDRARYLARTGRRRGAA